MLASEQNNDNTSPNVPEVGNNGAKRDEDEVEIRKGQKDEILQKKEMRKLDEDLIVVESSKEAPDEIENPEECTGSTSLKEHIDICEKKIFEPNQFRKLYEALHSDDKFTRHYGMIGMRKILSLQDRAPVQEAIDSHLVPKLVEFAKNDKEEQIQLEAAWTLTNIAAGTSEQTEHVLEAGGVPLFIKMLSSARIELIEQAVWALGNIAGDCPEYRDHILYNDVMKPLNKVINDALDDKQDNLVKQGTWTMSNLCRGSKLPEFDLVRSAIPTLSRVIQEQHDYEVLSNACWAMCHLSDGDEKRVEMVLETGIASSLVRILDVPDISILYPLLRIIGNIASSTDDHIDHLLEYPQVIEKLYKLLNHETKTVRIETAWVISNMSAGKIHQIEHLFAEPAYVHAVIKVALSDTLDARIEAACALSHAVIGGSPEQVEFLVKNGVLDCFCRLLGDNDTSLLEAALGGIYHVLEAGILVDPQMGAKENEFLVLLEQKGAIPYLEKLQHHENNNIYRKTLKILTKHFEYE